ncbi:unnamed protein product [Peniophora sp. CBMAI 1063]|nr:unnamed protein product [Peniophora sp. CBMAI 1063]
MQLPSSLFDCNGRQLLSAFQTQAHHLSDSIIAQALHDALAAGWYIPNIPSHVMRMSTRIKRRLSPDISIHAFVLIPFAHDTITNIYIGAITELECNRTTIHVSPRLVLLKTLRDELDNVSECDFGWCQCGLLKSGVDKAVMRALDLRLRQDDTKYEPTDVHKALAVIDIALDYVHPPTQFIPEFVATPSTCVFPSSPSNLSPIPARLLPPAISPPVHQDTSAHSHVACHCGPTVPGASQAISLEWLMSMLRGDKDSDVEGDGDSGEDEGKD